MAFTITNELTNTGCLDIVILHEQVPHKIQENKEARPSRY